MKTLKQLQTGNIVCNCFFSKAAVDTTFKPYMSMRHLDMDLNKHSGLENRGLLEKAVEEGFEMSTIKLLVQAHSMLLT